MAQWFFIKDFLGSNTVIRTLIDLQVPPTFDGGVGRRSFHAQVPRRVTLVGKVPHLQVADGEADDGGLVQLAGDGARQRQHLGQLVELKVLLPSP